VVDKLHGYLLKIDRNKYIKKGMLGFDALDAQTRKTTYNKEVVSFSEDNFVNIDSTSLLVGKCRHSSNMDFKVNWPRSNVYAEAMLFTHLVDLRQRNEVLQHMSYEEIYRYVRRAAVVLSLLRGCHHCCGLL
jgi:hypothetical protein